MRLWVFVLLITSHAWAHHNEFHHAAFPVHGEPRQALAYAVPVQIISAESAAPVAEVYSAPPAIYTAPSPQIFTATVAPAPQVFTAVTPAPQYAVENVEVQSYSVPSYSAPSYSVLSFSSPSYSAQSYSPQSSFAQSNSAQTYSTPSYSSKSYSVPSHSANTYQHSSPVSSVSSQITPLKTYSKSHSSPSSVKAFSKTSPSQLSKSSSHSYSFNSYSTPSHITNPYKYSAPASSVSSQNTPLKTYSKTYSSSSSSSLKPFSGTSAYTSSSKRLDTPQYIAVQFQTPVTQYQAPAVQYHSPAVSQYSSSAYVKPVAILRQSQDDSFDGSFSYDFQAENGIASSATGHVKQLSPKEQAQVIQGQYSYTAPDGTPVVTRWYADETGFHAEGSHLPVAPPVPEAIAKSLAYHGVA